VFREAGIRAEALDGNTPWEQRRAILARLHTGETRVVANVAVLGEGVDVPSVDAVILATPTRSQVKYTQCLGRGLRTFPGKEDCLVIDVVGASERLDLQTLPRLFNLCDVPEPEVTVTEALERARLEKAEIDRRRALERQKADERAAASGEGTADGELRSRPVSMLAARRRTARRLRWLRHRECWLVSLGSMGTLALVPDGSRWRVLRLHRNGHEQLAGGVDLGYAHRSALLWPTPSARASRHLQASGCASAARSLRRQARTYWAGLGSGRQPGGAAPRSRRFRRRRMFYAGTIARARLIGRDWFCPKAEVSAPR
jgi:hypothetical protein